MDNPDEKPHASSARSNAAGWGHDVRTSKGRMAMDSRQREGPCPYRRNLGEDRPRGGRDTANHAGGGRGEGGERMSGDARDLAQLCNTILSRSLAGEKGSSFYRDVDDAISLSRCVLSGSRPQLLDPPLGTTQEAIDLKAVSVGTDLRRDPAR